MLGWVSYTLVLTCILKCQLLGLHFVRFLHGVISYHSWLIFNLPFSSFGVILLIISSGSALLTLPQFELLRNLFLVEKRLPSGDLWASLWGIFLIDGWCGMANTVCGTTPSQDVLNCTRKQDDQAKSSILVRAFLHGICFSVLAFRFLPWIPVLRNKRDKSFPSKADFGHCVLSQKSKLFCAYILHNAIM